MLPTQRLDFGEPAAREHQQPDGRDRRAGLGAVLKDFVENRAQALELLGAQEALPLLFLEPLDVEARVRAVGSQAPHLGEVEHLREHAERAVGLVGRLAQAVVQLGDVASLDFRHLAAADSGIDEELDRTAVLVGRAGLAVGGNILVEKPLPKGLHGRSLAVGVALCGRVAAALGLGEEGHGAPARLFRREGRDGSEGHAARPALGAVLGDEELAAGGTDAHTEARQLSVPVEAIRSVGLEPVDGALGDLDLCRHGVPPVRSIMGSILSRWEAHGKHWESKLAVRHVSACRRTRVLQVTATHCIFVILSMFGGRERKRVGVCRQVSRQTHNLKVLCSNPAHAFSIYRFPRPGISRVYGSKPTRCNCALANTSQRDQNRPSSPMSHFS